MKIITVSGYEPIPIEYRIEYLRKKGIEFYVYAIDYSSDDHEYQLVKLIDNETLTEMSDWDTILSEKDLGENPSYTTAHNYNIEFDMRDLRRDSTFISIVESGAKYKGGLDVVEIKEGERFRISSGYDGYNDESYEVVEILNESDWELAEY